MGTGYNRNDRVGDLIMREISEMILKGEIKDPRVGSVIVTGVKVTKDLSQARLFITTMGKETTLEDALAGLQSARGFIKRELWKRFRLKRVPEIRFELDSALQEGYRIDDLLRGLRGE